MKKHKIGRLVLTSKNTKTRTGVNPQTGDSITIRVLCNDIKPFVSGIKEYEFDYVITPGGFIKFNFEEEKASNWKNLINDAEDELQNFITENNQLLKQVNAKYITFGLDGFSYDSETHSELVALYDLHQDKIVHWTGKTYPTESQKEDLVIVDDLDSHFIEINGDKLCLFGCHDLNMYSPRGNATMKKGSDKWNVVQKFQAKMAEFQPTVVIQHPHTTDTPNIWRSAWNKLSNEVDSINHFASGIFYFDPTSDKPRGELNDVLESTKIGDVVDIIAE